MFEKAHVFYDSMYLVGFIVMMIINLKTSEKHGIKKNKAVLYTFFTYLCGVIGALIMGKFYSIACSLVGFEGNSKVAIFGAIIFIPLLMLVFPVKKGDYKSLMDMLAPGVLVILLCAKFGCFVSGCCHGKPSSFGVQYIGAEEKYFPVQLFEVITMILVLFATQFYLKRAKHFTKGTVYPFTFAVYSVTRFFWEFFRYYEHERLRYFFLNMTFMQLCCVFVFITSVVIIIVLKNKEKKHHNTQCKN